MTAKRRFSTQYEHHNIAGLTCTDPSMAQQSFKDEADINHLLSHYKQHDLAELASKNPGTYGDFTELQQGTFIDAMNTINGIEQLMMDLPAKVRSRFKNNPEEILTFIADPTNRAEAIAIGLIQPPPEPARVEPAKT